MVFLKENDAKLNEINDFKRVALFFYKNELKKSLIALETLKKVSDSLKHIPFYAIDLEKIDDIHQNYDVIHIPTLVLVEEGKAVSWVMGAQKKDFYISALGEAHRTWSTFKDESRKKKYPRVTLYSSPTCYYCKKIKDYLKKNEVPYRDIDISKDQKAARRLVQKTGQIGVPQIFIGSSHLLGYNEKKINEFLGIKKKKS